MPGIFAAQMDHRTCRALTHKMFLYCAAEVPAELKISDEAEELEIGKLTKVGFLNARHRSRLRCFRQ